MSPMMQDTLKYEIKKPYLRLREEGIGETAAAILILAMIKRQIFIEGCE